MCSTDENKELFGGVVSNDVLKLDVCIKQTADYTSEDLIRVSTILCNQKSIDVLQLCQFTFEAYSAQLLVFLAVNSRCISTVTFIGCTLVNYIPYHGSLRHLCTILIFNNCKITREARDNLVKFLLGDDPSKKFIVDNCVHTVERTSSKCEIY